MSFANRWSAFASKLGTSPRQLVILLSSAAVAICIFGGKLLIAPKSAIAAPTLAAPIAAPKIVEPAPTAIPEVFLKAIPHWNLASNPARNPFTSPEDLRLAAGFGSPDQKGSSGSVKTGLVLHATLDRSFAVINGKTIRIGDSWSDPSTGLSLRLVEVGERNARLTCGSQEIELSLDG